MADSNNGSSLQASIHTPAFTLPSGLEDFQTDEQRRVLDTVAQIRKCGLETVLPLPQIVVCGDQSSGKSSVLEGLTEIPFPRDDNLCTRFATEITMRRAPCDALRLAIIPADTRTASEKATITAFFESIVDFADLPAIVSKAMDVMGLGVGTADTSTNVHRAAFTRDVLSIEIEGPKRPQLTIVDVPGLVHSDTKGVIKSDRDTVTEITDFYIKQSRTICLAVISATHDYATQPILTKVREVDPEGSRTLGVITKPDRLVPGSGLEASFFNLASNEDIFFKLGWHVVKNRKFEESHYSIEQRNKSELEFFQSSLFKALEADCRGIETLRTRLSGLLFDHISNELPNLRRDLDTVLHETTQQLEKLGTQRASVRDCRDYLTTLSLTCLEITRAAFHGHYDGEYFQDFTGHKFNLHSSQSVRRFRAALQCANANFAEIMRRNGPKFTISSAEHAGHSDTAREDDISTSDEVKRDDVPTSNAIKHDPEDDSAGDLSQVDPAVEQSKSTRKMNALPTPSPLTRSQALDWIGDVLVRSRGKEPLGNYNPLIIGEAFWELSCNWESLAKHHIDQVSDLCQTFITTLLEEKCAKDVGRRLLARQIKGALRFRKDGAMKELQHIVTDKLDFPLVYNHYYTDTVQRMRNQRMERALRESVNASTEHYKMPDCRSDHQAARVDLAAAAKHFGNKVEANMEKYSCEEALDCLLSIYKTQHKTFVANVAQQVIERHMVRGLDKIFSPLDVSRMSDEEVVGISGEPKAVRTEREFLADRKEKLMAGQDILQELMGRVM